MFQGTLISYKIFMRKYLSLFLAVILFVSNIHLETAYANTSSDEEVYEKATVFLAQLYDIDKELSKYGLSLNDLKKIPKKDPHFYQELSSYVPDISTDSSLFVRSEDENNIQTYSAVLDPSSKETAQRWIYAEKMARINNKRDNNVTDEGKESTYMYMSHFIDIREGRQIHVNPSISDDGYFSAWITNEDRRVYDIYLKGSKNAEAIKAASHTATGIVSFFIGAKDFSAIKSAQTFKQSFVNFSNGVNVAFSEYNALNDFDNFIQILNESEHSREAMDRFEKSISEKYDSEEQEKAVIKFCAGMVVAAASGGIPGLIISLGLEGINLTVDIYKDFFDRVWWLSLVRTNSLRVSYRIMRNQGWV